MSKPNNKPASKPEKKPPLNPAAVTVDAAATLLSQLAGAEVKPATIARHIKQGAPANPDGTIHLVRYAAWLLAQHPTRGAD